VGKGRYVGGFDSAVYDSESGAIRGRTKMPSRLRSKTWRKALESSQFKRKNSFIYCLRNIVLSSVPKNKSESQKSESPLGLLESFSGLAFSGAMTLCGIKVGQSFG